MPAIGRAEHKLHQLLNSGSAASERLGSSRCLRVQSDLCAIMDFEISDYVLVGGRSSAKFSCRDLRIVGTSIHSIAGFEALKEECCRNDAKRLDRNLRHRKAVITGSKMLGSEDLNADSRLSVKHIVWCHVDFNSVLGLEQVSNRGASVRAE